MAIIRRTTIRTMEILLSITRRGQPGPAPCECPSSPRCLRQKYFGEHYHYYYRGLINYLYVLFGGVPYYKYRTPELPSPETQLEAECRAPKNPHWPQFAKAAWPCKRREGERQLKQQNEDLVFREVMLLGSSGISVFWMLG